MERLYNSRYAEAQSRLIPGSLLKVVGESLPISSNDKVLEIGSGNGFMLSVLQGQTEHVIGLDINHFATLTPNAVKGDARQMPFRDNVFDKIISIHTLEHIDDLAAVFREMDRVMTSGGLTFHLFPSNFISKAEGAIFDAIRMNGLNFVKAWRDAHKLHIHRLNPTKIQKLTAGTNLKIVNSKRYFVPEVLSVNWGVLLEKRT